MDDIDKLEGRELDALVAERVLGWTVDRSRPAADGAPVVIRELPRYSAEPPLARGTQFTFEQRHPGIVVRIESTDPFTAVVRGPSGREYSATHASEATARCRALLKAAEGEGPGLTPDQVTPDRSPRAITTMAELFAAKAHAHQTPAILMQAVALQQGTNKEGAARALLGYAAPAKEMVPILSEQVAAGDDQTAVLCVAVLDRLLAAGHAARTALEAARSHPKSDIAAAAKAALERA